ncbi:unnamed protein product [Periconia digitata]|uniref:Uncharacterized protein n=1 Tax=Periconia digitata TaxID=1303443 RepID=A0A9W4UY51_9PLEO|nr:unnamed protein product [Periconia digitata]
MLDARSSMLVYILPLTLLFPIDLNYGKQSETSLYPLQKPSEASQTVNEGLSSAFAVRTALSVTFRPTTTAPASQDSVLATNELSEANPKTKPEIQRPKFTCPESEDRDEDIFFCDHCGGAKDVTPWTNDGEPNAKCSGLSDGMWEDCLCYEEPPQQVFPLERGKVDMRRKGQK